jgi:hypothetical protein
MDIRGNTEEDRRNYRKYLLLSVASKHKAVNFEKFEKLSEVDLINILVEINSPMLEVLYQCLIKYDMWFKFLIHLQLLYPNTNDVELTEEQEAELLHLMLGRMESSSNFRKKEQEIFGEDNLKFKSYTDIIKDVRLSKN